MSEELANEQLSSKAQSEGYIGFTGEGKSERIIYVQSNEYSEPGRQVPDYLKRPVARANINLDEIGSILVPVIDKELQQTVVNKFDESWEKSQRLKSEAENEWRQAKDWFEAQLPGK